MCLRVFAATICSCVFCLLFGLALGATVALAAPVPGQPAISALEVSIATAISPIQADLLDAALERARRDRNDMVLLILDTPGGSIDVMRRMVKSMLASPLPIVVWVAPSGARAASAGVFLVAAATVATMAPQTTIGSASPVGPGGGDLKDTMNAKIRNDLKSLLRGLVTRNDRNVDWYMRSISKAANLDALEAAQSRVIDFVAMDRTDLFAQLGKRGLTMANGVTTHFTAADVRVHTYETGLRHGILSWLIDPQIAYILLLLGLAGIYFELTTPGAILPGVIGSLSLLLALYALSVLPTNTAGLLLLLLGAVFFVLELFITSFGLLGLAGLASFLFGSLLLFRGDGLGGLPLGLVLPTVLGLAALLGFMGYLVTKAQLRRPASGMAALLGQTATVRHWQGTSGKVFINGELWQARSAKPLALAPGQTVVVTGRDDMTLEVEGDSALPAA